MAKFRSNHVDKDKPRFYLRLVYMMVFVCGATLFIFKQAEQKISGLTENTFWQHALENLEVVLPQGKVRCKRYYCFQYNYNTGQADWVAYRLSREQLTGKVAECCPNYTTDTTLGHRAINSREYIGSGFTKGHLVPTADMAFSDTARMESCVMSNIVPQYEKFNMGIWRELKFQIRQWAAERGNLLILTGPVFDTTQIRYLSAKKTIAVPTAFFKIICDPLTAQLDCVAFLIPHQFSDVALGQYRVSIDSIEAVTGIDFFAYYLTDELESQVESALTRGLWPLDSALYNLRIMHWNSGDSLK